MQNLYIKTAPFAAAYRKINTIVKFRNQMKTAQKNDNNETDRRMRKEPVGGT